MFNLLISLLTPRNNSFNCLGNYEKVVVSTLCKKPEEERTKEIRSYLYEPLIEYLTNEERMKKSCSDINLSRLSLALIKAMQGGIL